MKSKKARSKKLSNTKNSLAEQLDRFVFFVDRSSGRYHLVDGLRKLGLKVESHDDHFAPDTPDPVWITACGENNWIIVSSDKAIKKNLLERKAVLSARVAAFFFTSASISSSLQISAFQSALRRVLALVSNQKRPFIARISPNGSVELWLNHRGEDLLAKTLERKKSRK